MDFGLYRPTAQRIGLLQLLGLRGVGLKSTHCENGYDQASCIEFVGITFVLLIVRYDILGLLLLWLAVFITSY